MRNDPARADVAELLRQGATYRTIMQQLGVSAHVIAATRRAFHIRIPAGRRRLPEERVLLEKTVASLLLQGVTYKAITAQVGVSQPTVLRIRRDWGIPLAVREPRPRRTVAQTLALYAEAYGEGHVRWTGPYSGRMPTLNADGRSQNARHATFRRHHGRAPVGYVQPDCTEPQCVAGAHLTDTLIRDARPSGGEA